MQFRIRPAVVPDDAAQFVDLINQVEPEPVTVEKLLEWEANFPADGIRERVVAVDEADRIVGYADSDRVPWMNAGKFGAWVIVDKAHQTQGIGAALYAHVEEWALRQGATLLESGVRDNMPEALAFIQRRGWEIDRHIFDSTLDPYTFDFARFAGVVEGVKESGIRFFTLAEVDDVDALTHKLYEMVKVTVRDIPGNDEEQFAPYEQWHKWWFGAKDFRPDLMLIAAEGDRLAAVTTMRVVKESNVLWTQYTAVHPDFRGRKLALAIKLLAVEAARKEGVVYMRTNNDSKNAPMLAVNRKMGYVPCPGHYRVRKTIV